MNSSYVYIMKRCLFRGFSCGFYEPLLLHRFSKAHRFAPRAPRAPMLRKSERSRGGWGGGSGAGSARHSPAPGPARTRTWPGPAFFLRATYRCAMGKIARNASRCSREVSRIGDKRICKWKQINEPFVISWHRNVEFVLAIGALQDVSSFF